MMGDGMCPCSDIMMIRPVACIGFEYECVERCGRHRMHIVVISRCTVASGSFIRALDSTMK